MQQHPIPRQMTTFEFKLIGFLTLKQFIYLVVFILLAVVVFYLFPIPVLNLLFSAIILALGVVFAFIPIQGRPASVWAENLYKSLTSPTQYVYKKNNPPIYFLNNLVFAEDPHRVEAHVESKEKLKAYLQTRADASKKQTADKQKVTALFHQQAKQKKKDVNKTSTTTSPVPTKMSNPFLFGVVKNNKNIVLPGMLVYLNDEQGKPVRLMKTNLHGVFATFRSLKPGNYTIEAKDPEGKYFFDTMKISAKNENKTPFEIISKELL